MPLPYDPNDPNAQPPPGGPPPGGAPPPEAPVEQGQDTGPETPEEDQQDPAMPPAVGDQEQGITPASPEEQAAHDHFVGKAWQLIYSDKMFPQVVKMLSGGAGDGTAGNPVTGLATATDMVVARVANMAEQGGEQLQPDVVFHAGADILEELAEISRRGKIKDYSQDPDGLEKAWFGALDLFRERLQKAGELDQGHAQGDLGKLVEMDKNGQLDKIMRDLAASDSNAQAGGPTGPTGPNAPKGFKPKGLGGAAAAPPPPAQMGAQ